MTTVASNEPLDLAAVSPGRHRRLRRVATMADGSTIALPVNVLKGDRDGPRLVAIAGLHSSGGETFASIRNDLFHAF